MGEEGGGYGGGCVGTGQEKGGLAFERSRRRAGALKVGEVSWEIVHDEAQTPVFQSLDQRLELREERVVHAGRGALRPWGHARGEKSW